jgi:para-nitrobenzyl esterase
MVGALLGLPATEVSEDCLTLNVWTPAAGDGRRRPVLVWIHGGAFVFGSGSQAPYEGAQLSALGDVVVVTLNYRLGALGFLALPALAEEEGGVCGNFGLLDQIAALEWVRDHAAVFGGDPDRVTIFGESAGAMSVGTLLGTPAARGLFRNAIAQSGAAHNVSTPEQGERVAHAFMKELGLALTDVEGLRATPVSAILAAQQRILGGLLGSVAGLPFQPVVDGRVLPRQPLEAIADGEASGVSLLVGTNRDEWRLFALADAKLKNLDEERLLRRLERVVPGRDSAGRSHAERALEIYRRTRAAAGEEASPISLWNAIEGDRVFGVPAARLAEAQSAHAPGVYRYLFTWESPVLGGALGACHGLDVPFVFGTATLPALRAFVGEGSGVEQLCARIQGAWIAFAEGRSPGHAALPQWPRYDPTLRPTLLLGSECSLAKMPGDEQLQFWDGLL